MSKIKRIFLVGLFVMAGFANTSNASNTQERIKIAVSIAPQVFFVQKIGGDRVEVANMVPQNKSPEIYEPLPSQLKLLADSKIYFGIGMPFEKRWLERFKSTNRGMKIVDLSNGLNRRISTHSHKDSHSHKAHKHSHSHDAKDYDPHVWLSPNLVEIMAKKICDELIEIDSKNREFYEKNLALFLKEIENLKGEISAIFSSKDSQKAFLVYHPAFGYFADSFGLSELSLEFEGKSIKPSNIKDVAESIERENIGVIFTQPQSSKTLATNFAKEWKLKIDELDTLSKDWAKNLMDISRKISNSKREK